MIVESWDSGPTEVLMRMWPHKTMAARKIAPRYIRTRIWLLTPYRLVGMASVVMNTANPKPSAKTKLLEAALSVIRTKGYSATSVEDLCEAAGVTKGAFFHHFRSKEDLAVAAAQHWSHVTGALFEAAPYHQHPDPLERILGYLDFRKELLKGTLPEVTCLVGTMVQETFATHPAIRDACNDSISGHAAKLESEILAAIEMYGTDVDVTPSSLALFIQAALQGAFILAKARNSPDIAAECIGHLRQYVESLFKVAKTEKRT